jgi:23S rRNA pseudouridine1911/1915/1917 synthase
VILAETPDFVALDKPAGVSMATSSKHGSGGEAVRRLLEACGEAPQPELRLVHRLDVGTSGVVLLARTEEAHRRLTLALQNRRARKTYRALVWGRPVPAEGTYADPLGRDPKDGRRMRVRPDGKPASTKYRTLARLPSVTDLELHPETGRTHQIRVHLSAHGHPIVETISTAARHGGAACATPAYRRALAAARRPLLHALQIEIPELGIDVEAPLPEDYRASLELLSRGTGEDRSQEYVTDRLRDHDP